MQKLTSFILLLTISIGLCFFVLMMGSGWFLSRSYCSGRTFQEACDLPLYPKWEYLSLRHGNEFFEPIQLDVNRGCLTEPAKSIKVMQYKEEKALVWYKGESGSTWIARFYRPTRQSTWSMRYGREPGCHVDVINSKTGGSADGYYWYN